MILTRPAVEAGERLGFLPGDLAEKVDPYMRPLYDALHDMLDFERRRPTDRARDDRGGAARVHARSHAERLLRHPRRGPEHDGRADEDVPHATRLQFEGRDHRRRHADRPAERHRQRPGRGDPGAATASTGIGFMRVHEDRRRPPSARAVDHPAPSRAGTRAQGADARAGSRRTGGDRTMAAETEDERVDFRTAPRSGGRRAGRGRAVDVVRLRRRARRSCGRAGQLARRALDRPRRRRLDRRSSTHAIAGSPVRPTCSRSRCSRAITRNTAAPARRRRDQRRDGGGQARERRRASTTTVARLLVHGVLHLLGHDHEGEDEARHMRAEERRIWREVRA